MTREDWLYKANEKLIPYIQQHTTLLIPRFYLSVGFPKGKYVGQCWSGKLSEDGLPHIFISPTVDDPIDVLSILGHEIIHTVLPNAGHRVEFSQLAAKCGYIKPWTGHVINNRYKAYLEEVAKELGEYKHSKLSVPIRGSKGSRLRKYVCSTCNVIVYKGGGYLNAECLETFEEDICGGNFLLATKEQDNENDS